MADGTKDTIYYVFLLVLNSVLFESFALGSGCISQEPCSCQIDEYSRVDLGALSASLKVDTFIKAWRENATYYFHGCQDGNYTYKANSTIDNTTTVQGSLILEKKKQFLNFTLTEVTVLGLSNQIRYDASPEGYDYFQISYVNANQSSQVLASIILLCDDIQQNFLSVLQWANSSHRLVISSPTLCFHKEQAGLSTGSVLLILFFFAFGTYLLGGMMISYFFRGARGIEIIPNIDFWRSLPGLVKDGLIFLLSGCRPNLVSASDSYDRI